MKPAVLHITPDFNYACGRSYYVFLLLKYLKKYYNVHLLTNGGDSFDRLEDYDINYHVIKGLHSKNPLKAAGNINGIRKFIKSNNIRVVHTHHRLSELLARHASVRSQKTRTKFVFTSLSMVNRKYNVEFKSDKIIAVSRSIEKMLTKRFGVNQQRVSLIPNFTDTEEIHELEIIAPKAREHGKLYNILAIGRFHHEKNFETLLEALSIISEQKIELILVGEGDNSIDYKKYIARHDLNVEIIVPQKNLLQYFLIADLCVLPSIKDPFPNFMLQAGLHKKPFIGTNVDGIAELIKDGENGMLFKSRDSADLAGKILKFRNNPVLAENCARNLHRDVINHYTQEFIIPKIRKLYDGLLNQ
jgi:L-malate glycosyltransferase